MTDIFSKEKRSYVMSRICGKGNKLDKCMAKLLRRSKIRYRSYPDIFGNPDFLVGENVALFCDGSFWHGRNWKMLKARLESGNNPEYWVDHIARNRKRDRKVNRVLRSMDYKVIRLWDTDITSRPNWCMRKIRENMG